MTTDTTSSPPRTRTTPRAAILLAVGIVVGAAALRLICFVSSNAVPDVRQVQEDSIGYKVLGENLAAGRGFARYVPVGPDHSEVWRPELCRTPGYPAVYAFFVMLTHHPQMATVLLQVVLNVALCAAVMLVCWRAFGVLPGLIAGVFMAVDLQAAALSNVLLTATLYGFLMFAAAVTTAHAVGKRSLASATLAALLIGISTLIRPTSLYLPTLIGGILLIRAAWRRDGRSAVVALLVATIGNGVIGAWVYRNGVVCGEYTLCAIPRYNLLASHAAGTLGRARGESRRLTRDVLCEKIGIDVMTLRFLPLTAEQERAVKKLAIETFRDHKAAFLQEHLIRSANTFCGPEKHILKVLGYRDISFGVHEPDHPVETNPSLLAWGLLLAQVPFLGAIYLGALWTLVQRVRGRPMPVIVWTCFGLAVYLIVLSSGVPGDPRLRWPVIPLLIVVAAAGLRRPSCSFPEPARDE